MKKLSFELESILLDTLFANGLAAMYLTKANAVLYSGLTVLINLPVANFTGIFNITLPATSKKAIGQSFEISTVLYEIEDLKYERGKSEALLRYLEKSKPSN